MVLKLFFGDVGSGIFDDEGDGNFAGAFVFFTDYGDVSDTLVGLEKFFQLERSDL